MKKLIYLYLILLSGCTGMVDSLTNEDLGNGYQYDEVGGYPVIFRDLPTYKVIPTVIVSYDYNDNFIVALQAEKEIKSGNKKLTIEESVSFIRKNGSYHFWIISHKNDSIYGPLNMNEYLLYKRKLGIADELKVKIEL